MRRIGLVTLAALIISIITLPTPAPTYSQNPTPTIDKAATRAFTRQYRTASYSALKRYSLKDAPQNVTFTAVVGQILDSQTAWMKLSDGFALVHTALGLSVVTGARVTVYGVVQGRVTLDIGGQPASIPNIIQAIVVDSGRIAALRSGLPSAIPPTRTPAPTAFVCPRNCKAAVAAGLSEEQAGKCPNLDRDHDGKACYGN
jgi:hypothetical protein